MSCDVVLRYETLAWPVTWRRVSTTPHREGRSLSNGLPLKYAILVSLLGYPFLVSSLDFLYNYVYSFLVSFLEHMRFLYIGI